MIIRNETKKLNLRRESLRTLTTDDLRNVPGGPYQTQACGYQHN